jgi:hypothetical protein
MNGLKNRLKFCLFIIRYRFRFHLMHTAMPFRIHLQINMVFFQLVVLNDFYSKNRNTKHELAAIITSHGRSHKVCVCSFNFLSFF